MLRDAVQYAMLMRVNRPNRHFAVLVVVAAAVFAGCASDTSSGTPTTAKPTVTSAPEASATPDSTTVAAKSVTTESVTTESATSEPVVTEPATTESVVVAPADVRARPSAGCGTDAAVPGETLVAEPDLARPGRALEILPSAYDGVTPLPLVFDLHGYQSPLEIERLMSNFSAVGEREGFVVVTPQIDNVVPRWDATIGSADVAFIGQLLDRELATHCIDQARVYAAGLSNGAFMASAVACDLSARVAAVGTVAGIRDLDGCTFARPVPVVAFHGTADTFVSYDGGFGPSVANLPTDDGGTLGTGAVLPSGPSVEEIAAAWARRNGCNADPPTSTEVAVDVKLLAFDCPADATVELYRVTGGGHAWPGSAFSTSIASVVGTTTLSIDATELMWSFFVAHPLQGSNP